MPSEIKKRNRRGAGSLFQKPKGADKPWHIQYYQRDPETGKSEKRREYCSLPKAQAQRLLNDRVGRLARGEQFDAGRPHTVHDLQKALHAYTASNVQPCSRKLRGLKWRWDHLQPFFAHLTVDRVTTTRINEYKTIRRNEGAAVATVNRELATLRRMFRYGKQCTPPLVHNVPHFGLAKENNARKGFVENHQYTRMAEEANKDGLWLRTFLELAYSFGWRCGELLNLRVRHVNLRARTLRLDPGTTKNGEGREVPIFNDPLLELLRQACDGKQSDDALLARDDGAPVRSFQAAWRNMCVRAGVGGWHCSTCDIMATEGARKCPQCEGNRKYAGLIPHDLRRSAARNLRQAGVNENVIMSIGGWKTRSMFDRYAIVNNKDKERAMQALDAVRQADATLSPLSAPAPQKPASEATGTEVQRIQ
jgi:integrase